MSFFNSIFNILRFNKKNWRAVALCIFTATVFWFFNALNKSYTTSISFPLVFDYDRENYISVRPLPEVVRLNVTGIGWNLFRRSSGVKVPPLVIPLERPGDVRKIVGSTLPAFLSNQLSEFQINFVITDTLHLAIEPKATRTVRLDLDVADILFRDGYTVVSPIVVKPDSILLEGPAKLIASLSNPVYLKIDQRNIDENFNDIVDVKFLNDELIRRDPLTVSVKFDVDRLTPVSDSVRLVIINAPKHAWPFIERKELPCELAIPQGFMQAYHRDSVRAVIDLKHIKKGQNRILPELKGLPPFTKILKLDSVSIKF